MVNFFQKWAYLGWVSVIFFNDLEGFNWKTKHVYHIIIINIFYVVIFSTFNILMLCIEGDNNT